MKTEDALKGADIVIFLVPDMVQRKIYAEKVKPVLKPVDKEELALPTLPPGGKLREVIVSDPRKGNKNTGRL